MLASDDCFVAPQLHAQYWSACTVDVQICLQTFRTRGARGVIVSLRSVEAWQQCRTGSLTHSPLSQTVRGFPYIFLAHGYLGTVSCLFASVRLMWWVGRRGEREKES